jgi:hypothetical protein
VPSQHERDPIAPADVEFRRDPSIPLVTLHGAAQLQGVGPGGRTNVAVDQADPRRHVAVVEPDRQIHGMLGVSAMAVQNALVQISLRGRRPRR